MLLVMNPIVSEKSPGSPSFLPPGAQRSPCNNRQQRIHEKTRSGWSLVQHEGINEASNGIQRFEYLSGTNERVVLGDGRGALRQGRPQPTKKLTSSSYSIVRPLARATTHTGLLRKDKKKYSQFAGIKRIAVRAPKGTIVLRTKSALAITVISWHTLDRLEEID